METARILITLRSIIAVLNQMVTMLETKQAEQPNQHKEPIPLEVI